MTPSAPPTPTPEAPQVDLERVESLPLYDDAPLDGLAAALERDLDLLARRGDDAPWKLGRIACSNGVLRRSLEAVLEVIAGGSGSRDALLDHMRDQFDFYRSAQSAGRSDGALFTGYYEPVLEGRRQRGGAFVHPIYRRPPDLLALNLGDFDANLAGTTLWARVDGGKLAPYFSRQEIDGGGALASRGLELFWLDDPVGRFFLQVQGSGIVRLEDGSTVRVGFAGSNGRPYTSIGRVLAEDGSLAGMKATAPAIQRYLHDHPERQAELLYRNERYVFFREVPEGPLGRLGAQLTAGRSIAVDATIYPLGGLAYVGIQGLRRFVLVQDTGAAITGPERADIFFGTGDRAGQEAGVLSSRGDLVFLLPRACA